MITGQTQARACVPQHVGIIMDGNRRFAKKLMLQPWKGHEWGAKKLEDVMRWCREAGVKTVTLYALSLENLSGRPHEELEYLMGLMKEIASGAINNKDHYVHTSKVRVSVFGRLELLPEDVRNLIAKGVETTKDYSDYFLNFAIAYGGRQEISDAVKKILNDVKAGTMRAEDVDENTIKNNLYTSGFPDPDLIIRTGGERRLSNFLLFQSAYAELSFVDKSWPELEKEDITSVLGEFGNRQRRFGK